jgi:malonyl-CoA/methylmalonyl-CoA synthetase
MTNLYSLIADAALQAGNRSLIEEGGKVRLRYDELAQATARYAHVLCDSGARPGDRIVVQVEKSTENVLLYLATLRAGLIYVPLNTAYTPAELAYFISDAEPAIVICDPAKAEAIQPLARDAMLLTLGADGTGTLPDRVDAISEPDFEIVARSHDDLAAILYTSGTTGRSKGAMLSHGNLSSNALTLKEYWQWQDGDVLIHALPIYHVHGLFVALHGALLNGSTIIFHRSFDCDKVLADFERATILMGVPTFYVRLAAHRDLTMAACANMRVFISGSAPLLEATFDDFARRSGHTILERYGMTEAGMITSNPYDGERIAGTVGYALPGVSVRVSADGHEVARGEPGVLEIKGPNLFRGYWRNPEKTAEEMRPDGYFITGDIATMADDGRIAIVGRAKDLIIAGGLNIYPKEIELAIDAVPGVGESAVIGVAHPDLGEAVVAVATRIAGATVNEAEVLKSIADRLARFKQPRRVMFVDQLPRNAMGKVQKAELRKRFAGLFA